MSAPRVLFHVQHLLGIGHWRRATAIAEAMAAAGLEVTLLSGGSPEGPPPAGVALVQLPPARAADATFRVLIHANGRPLDDEFRAERRRLALAALERVRPALLFVESWPFGRRAFAFEIEPLAVAARALPRPALVVASIRDILVARRDPARDAAIVAAARRHLDRVLVHGDPALVPLEASFPAAAALGDLLSYTGYVVAPPGPDDGLAGAGEVIVSAGGGAVGSRLLRAALGARALGPLAAAPWRLIAGPHLPAADYAALASALPPSGVALERFRPDFPALLGRCRLSISQAGYNTVMDLLRAGPPPAVLVPFAAAAETEQALRAGRLAAAGLATLVEESALAPETLAAAIDAALAQERRPAPPLALDGAAETARQLLRALRNRGW